MCCQVFLSSNAQCSCCREYIGPVLVAAVIIVLAIRPAVGAIQERLLLRPEQAVLGTLAWGPVDYVVFYRLFMIIVAEVGCVLLATFADIHLWGVTHCCLIYPFLMLQAKWSNIEHALCQHIMQVAGARDTLARQVEQWKQEHNAGRKRSFWEVCAYLH